MKCNRKGYNDGSPGGGRQTSEPMAAGWDSHFR